MGLFDKLFGRGKTTQPTTLPSTPLPVTPTDAAPPPRRERSKPAPASVPAEASSQDTPVVSVSTDENIELIRAIEGVIANDSQLTREALYDAILKSTLYLVSIGNEELGDAEEIPLDAGQQVALATIRDPNGNLFLPAFTDLDRMEKSVPENARFIRVGAQAMCQMFLQGQGAGIVINPGQVPSGMLTRAEAQALAGGQRPQFDDAGNLVSDAPQSMQLTLGKAPEPPAESFVEAIRTAAAAIPDVREIHWFHAGVGDQPVRPMIGVLMSDTLTPEQMHPAFEAIGQAAMEARVNKDDAFDMMPLNEQLVEAIKQLDSRIYARDAAG